MNHHEICNIILLFIFIHKIHLTQPPPIFQLYNSPTSEYCSTWVTSSTEVEGGWHTVSINTGTAIFGQRHGRICSSSESRNHRKAKIARHHRRRCGRHHQRHPGRDNVYNTGLLGGRYDTTKNISTIDLRTRFRDQTG